MTPSASVSACLVGLVIALPVSAQVPSASASRRAPASGNISGSSTEAGRRSARIHVLDVELTEDRGLTGNVVGVGKSVTQLTEVTLRRGRHVYLRAKTDSRGRFRLTPVRGGVFELTTAGVSQIVRVWSFGTGPKNARRKVVLVEQKTSPTIRAQSPLARLSLPGSSLARTGILVGATVGVSAVVIEQTNDDDDAPSAATQNRVASDDDPPFLGTDPLSFAGGGDLGVFIDQGALSPN